MSPHCIYQYWNGPTIGPVAQAGGKSMIEYAQQVLATYRFKRDEYYTRHLCRDTRFYDSTRPIWDDQFHIFNRVLYADMDVFAVPGLKANIFTEPLMGFGMIEEPNQPAYREGRKKEINGRNDDRWAQVILDRWGIEAWRDAKGRVRTFNAGVILFSMAGMVQAKARFLSIPEYIRECARAGLPDFYGHDQNYLMAMAFSELVPFTELSLEWNRCIQPMDCGDVYDARTPETKFVHVQCKPRHGWDAQRCLEAVKYGR
jgi:hypothetical protein